MLTYEQAEFLASFGAEQDVLQGQMRATVEKSQRLVMHDVDAAYADLESFAGRLVAKSDGRSVSRDQAIDAALRTEKGKRLYSRYVDARDRVAHAAELAQETRSMREARRWAEIDLNERVAKSVGRGEDPAVAYARELADPETAAAVGLAPVTTVQKGDRAWSAIEQAADRLVAKGDDPLSRAQAVDRALAERPELYDAYMQEVQA